MDEWINEVGWMSGWIIRFNEGINKLVIHLQTDKH